MCGFDVWAVVIYHMAEFRTCLWPLSPFELSNQYVDLIAINRGLHF
uniref:Uncharacterized protein n=1 Tax=Rhizophora mucronata TaxID=61149 RepID=A0A2P2Q9B8_RHIMU